MHEDNGAIRALIQQKADVNAALPDGTTALHWAVQADDLETVGLLIQAGREREGEGSLRLHSLVFRRDQRQRGRDPEAAGGGGRSERSRRQRRDGADDRDAQRQCRRFESSASERRERERQGLRHAADGLDVGGAVEFRCRGSSFCSNMAPRSTRALGSARLPRLGLPGRVEDRMASESFAAAGPSKAFSRETPGGMTPLLYAARDGRIDIATDADRG